MNDFLHSYNSILMVLTGTIFNTVLTTIPIVGLVYLLARKLMKEFIEGRERSRYDDIKREAALSDIRTSYENRLADLTREMVATRVRWEDANHLLITGQRNQSLVPATSVIDVDRFLKPYGIDPDSMKVIKDKVFVLTPFSNAERETYDAIRSVCQEVGFEVSRGDERRADGDILPQIVEGILSSQIIIANISSRNPNVFFELGIAMALGKTTLLVSDTLSDVPFDIQSRRIIIFKDVRDLKEKLINSLLQAVRNN